MTHEHHDAPNFSFAYVNFHFSYNGICFVLLVLMSRASVTNRRCTEHYKIRW